MEFANPNNHMNTINKLLLAGLLGCSAFGASAQGTAFTYQGRLDDGASPANGSYDLTFALYDAASGGSQVGGVFTNAAAGVSNGLFTVTLDFGNQFPGADRWLEIGVRTNGADLFSILEPRQPLTATPYAVTAGGVSTAAQLNASNLSSGTVADTRLSGNVALRSGGNTFTGNQAVNGDLNLNGVLNLNTPPYPGVTAFLRARPGDNLPLAVQGTNGVNLLLVFTNGQVNIAGDLFVGGKVTGSGAVLSGSVGIGTASASQLLQVGSGATPNSQGMISLASRSGTGAAARTWEIGVPETDNDVTGPGYSFVINDTQNGASPELMVKYGSGNVGIGTTNPAAKLDVSGDILGTGRLNINSAGFGDVTALVRARSGDNLPFVVQDSGGTNLLRVSEKGETIVDGTMFARARPGDSVAFAAQNSLAENLLTVSTNGAVDALSLVVKRNAEIGGEITTTAINLTSDRNAKEEFKPVDARAVLDKVAQLPITEWQYKANGDTRHIGPMAQDFHAAFGVGRDERHITSVDADGVALAAIQGLNHKLEDKTREVEALKRSVAELRDLVNRLMPSSARGSLSNP